MLNVMKKSLLSVLLASIAFYGCQVEELNDIETVRSKSVFTATIEDNYSSGTKTSLGTNGDVLWKKGDRISVFKANTVNRPFQVSDDSNGKTEATLEEVASPGGLVTGTDIGTNIAFYPYAPDAYIVKSGDVFYIRGVTIPAVQSYSASSFGNGAFPMAAVAESADDTNLRFKNILGGIKLQLRGNNKIQSIRIRGNNNEILCGTADIDVSNLVDISLTDLSATTVTLDCGDGVQLDPSTATSFIIALPPVYMPGGFNIKITDTDGHDMDIFANKPQTVMRSCLLVMPEMEYQGVDYLNEPFTITSIGETSVQLANFYSDFLGVSLEYRTCNSAWMPYSGQVVELTAGASFQLRAGEVENKVFSSGYHRLSIRAEGTGYIDASGNIMSLLDRTLQSTSLPVNCFRGLFYSCYKLNDASCLKLPATTIADSCYMHMFFNCKNLTAAPELPATTLSTSCYSMMFGDCKSLTVAPELPATVLSESCYEDMFYHCTSLIDAPKLPAVSLPRDCYLGMFRGCTSLITAPQLPATTLASSCYFAMFAGCMSLTTAPELPAMNLAGSCYAGMFSSCTSLVVPPELPAVNLSTYCYAHMFQGCASLIMAPRLPARSLRGECYKKMFSGCVSLISAPELPSISVPSYCYAGMFEGCIGLTTAPKLPATDLAKCCYERMFAGCANLNYVRARFKTMPGDNYTKDWLKGVSSAGTFVKNRDATWDVTGASGVPDGWTIVKE